MKYLSKVSFVSFVVSLMFAVPVYAQTLGVSADVNANTTVGSVGVSTTISVEAQKIITASDTAIENRLTALTNLEARINALAKLSASEKNVSAW